MSNEYIDWIEKSIVDEHINYYKYSDFKLVQQIGHDPAGNVVCASWKHSNDIFALKSFKNEKTTLKEVVNEVRIYILFQDITIKFLKSKTKTFIDKIAKKGGFSPEHSKILRYHQVRRSR